MKNNFSINNNNNNNNNNNQSINQRTILIENNVCKNL